MGRALVLGSDGYNADIKKKEKQVWRLVIALYFRDLCSSLCITAERFTSSLCNYVAFQPAYAYLTTTKPTSRYAGNVDDREFSLFYWWLSCNHNVVVTRGERRCNFHAVLDPSKESTS